MEFAPIVLFAYNRLWHLQKTIDSLVQNPIAKKSLLYIYSDFAKNSQDLPQVLAVRSYLQNISGFKAVNIILRERNWGLAPSIIAGVTEVLAKHTKAIVLEDDLVCTPNFLQFMNDCLQFYEDSPEIGSISGYSFPITIPANYPLDVYIGLRASSWGWATWRNRWQEVDWQVTDFQEFIRTPTLRQAFNRGGNDLSVMLHKQQLGKISSWAIRWCYHHFKQQQYCLYPTHSQIQNIGADATGIHTPKTQKYKVSLRESTHKLVKPVPTNEAILEAMRAFFKPSLYRRLLNWYKFGYFS